MTVKTISPMMKGRMNTYPATFSCPSVLLSLRMRLHSFEKKGGRRRAASTG